ncbi:MAG: T9SS type A sorting domain-containing protein [Flavobacteriales bacterium]|nr:T9SS type A sorting domain-containing protein [Flavobacteriales bacterium]
MKKLLLLIITALSFSYSQAQVCNPDMTYASSGPGVYPFTIATPDCSDTLGFKTIVSISDTTVHVTSPITLDVSIYYDSTRVVSVSGLPTGLYFGTDVDGMANSFAPYGAWVNSGTVPNVTPAIGCVYVHGSPAAWQAAQLGGDTGVYVLQVEYDARIVQTVPDVSAFGIPNGTWLSDVDPQYGGGSIIIQVPMDTDPITDLQVPTVSGNASAFLNTSETYTASSGAASYNWTVDGGTIQSGQGTESVTVIWDGGVSDGSVTVEVGDGEGCTKSQTYDVAVAGVGISEADILNTHIFPNPSTGIFNVGVETNGAVQLTVFDLSGKLIRTEQFSGSVYRMDASELPAGAYLLKLQTEEGTSVSRIIIE